MILDVYSVSELDPDAKQKAIETFRNINVDDSGWYDFLISAKARELEETGIFINEQKVEFDLNTHHMCFHHFGVELNNEQLLKRLEADHDWKRFFSALAISALLTRGEKAEEYIEVTETSMERSESYVQLSCDYDVMVELFKSAGETLTLEEIEKLVEGMGEAVAAIVDEDARKLLKELNDEYAFQTSDEAVMETLNANDYLFTSRGAMIDTMWYPIREKAKSNHAKAKNDK